MTTQEFIDSIAGYIKKYAAAYNVCVFSPIIAQAILESDKGTSELAVNAHNYFGLKYRKGRCKTCVGVYHKVGSEQNPDGTYTSSAMEWCKFGSMEDGVIGYFDFTNISTYSNLKGVTDPRQYLENIKADGYATSLKYVDNLMAVIERYDLTRYDKEEMKMSNSSLVSYTKISPNKNSPRNHAIDRITPHCVVGQLSAESICGCFTSPSRQASCNYGIGYDGRISLCVEEKDRSWCSSSSANDHRAVTIECASDKTHPYAMTNAVYASLIKLCVDICQRNGKTKLLWLGDKDKTLNYAPKADEMILTVHRWFANKSCPGNWMYARMGDLAEKVTAALGTAAEPVKPTTPTTPSTIKKGDVVRILSGATYYSGKAVPNWVAAKQWIVREVSGDRAVIDKSVDGKNAICSPINVKFLSVVGGTATPTPSFSAYRVKITADALNIRKGPGTGYGTNGCIRDHGVYTIVAESTGTGATKWGKLKSGAGWISLDYTKKV